ncbi:MAG: hypothetical protein DRJ44_00200 [Thermoprotei archaeon]|nr:MAG: hypothetical protein DRJ44_00200 [Thermoprotei archaeon]
MINNIESRVRCHGARKPLTWPSGGASG